MAYSGRFFIADLLRYPKSYQPFTPRCTSHIGCLLPGGLTLTLGLSLSKSGLDFHQQADDDFQDTPRIVGQLLLIS
jgi:hypothetical protein